MLKKCFDSLSAELKLLLLSQYEPLTGWGKHLEITLLIKQMLSLDIKEQNKHSQLNLSCSQLRPVGITTAVCIGTIETKDLS